MSDPVKLQMTCKNCAKLFTLTKTLDPDDSATFSNIEEALDVFRQWELPKSQEPVTRFMVCPSCKRAYQYSSADIFVAFPLSSHQEARSIVPPPPP